MDSLKEIAFVLRAYNDEASQLDGSCLTNAEAPRGIELAWVGPGKDFVCLCYELSY